MYKIPELLAPAGGMEQLKAAVENGADAVYMGGKLFNARINAANFDTDEMREAIAYAHLRGVKLHVTMNTLIKDSELSDALRYAASLYEYGADALIVQDLGFASLVRKHIPDFELHLSTQGTVYNIEGVKKAKELGFKRVVLAREMTLEEISDITEEDVLEIEVFAHGALCICYSGQCQMSREIGGRSGNRGECAQPCRLPYSVFRADQDVKNQENPACMKEVAPPSFTLSPKDFCTVEQVGQLAEAGVASLKIEGRMKTAEYVAVVTGIYRKYLDLYAKQGRYSVDPADRKDLAQIFSRGNFTEGYLHENPRKKLMSGDLSKHQGIYIGKVISSTATGKSSKSPAQGETSFRQRGLVTIQLADKLSVGDGIEIHNRELSGNLVTFMKRGDMKADAAKKGEMVTVGYIDGTISPGDQVYKITDKELMLRARASYEGKSGSAEKALRKTGVSFRFTAGLDKPTILIAADEEGNLVTKMLPEKAEQALTKALSEEVVKAQLEKTGGTPFRVEECAIDIEEGISLPLSKINELRRAILEELELLRRKSRNSVTLNWSLSEVNAKGGKSAGVELSGKTGPEEERFLYFYRVSGDETIPPDISRVYVPYTAILNGFCKDDERVVPVIPNITKGWHDINIRKNFDKIVAASVGKGVSVGNLGWIAPFVEAGVNVFGDYGLNLYNSADFLLARELGISEAVISHEASLEEMVAMDFHGILPEAAVAGRIPVMTSEHCPVGDLNFCSCSGEQASYFLKDRKGQFYPMITNPAGCQSVILSHKETNLLNWKDELKMAGIKRFRIYAG